MKVYIDVIFIINFIFDFIAIISTSIILKRNIKMYRIFLGSFCGSLSLSVLFIRFNSFYLFIYKLVISIVIILSSFGFKDIRYFFKNIYYFYLISIVLGGIIYFFNNQFSTNRGLLFINNYSNNIIVGLLISIIGIIIYIKNIRNLKNNYNKYLNGIIYFDDYFINICAFIDTGNKLIDPYTFKPIILVEKSIIKNNYNVIIVPYKTCNNDGLLECIRAKRIYIEGIGYKKNFLIGLTDKIELDGVNCILNEKLLEG